jgi:hypothetical protein
LNAVIRRTLKRTQGSKFWTLLPKKLKATISTNDTGEVRKEVIETNNYNI